MLAIVLVCVCVLITWSLTDWNTSKFIMAASCDERFLAFLAARHRDIL